MIFNHKKRTLGKYGALLICVFLFSKEAVGNPVSIVDADKRVWSYLMKADSCIRTYDLEQAKCYIDSASIYENQVENIDMLGFLYSKYGDYYSFILNEEEAHKNYFKAIEYYEKTERTNLLVIIYNNLAFAYFQKKDTETLKKIIDKVLPLALAQNDSEDILYTYRIIAFYYDILFEKEKNMAFLDSAIFYNKTAISMYELDSQSSSPHPKNLKPDEIAYNYINLASNLYKKGAIHTDTVDFFIAKAEESANPNDTAMLVNIKQLKGLIAYKNDEIGTAKQLYNDLLIWMDKWAKGAPLSMYVEVFQKLSEIAEKQKAYSEALEYERKRNEYLTQIHDAQKYEIIRELETKHEVRQKEQEVTRLTELTAYQKKINRLYLFILILLLIALFVAAGWLRVKKKAKETQIALMYSEKNEALLQVKLKEEQLSKEKLEKYEALLDSHFKNLKIKEMDDELKEFESERQKLNVLIDEYSRKLNEYEKRKSHGVVFKAKDTNNSTILFDLFELINRRIKDTARRKELIDNLTAIYDVFFLRLTEHTEGEALSVLEIKRCVAIIIGMEVSEISECFSVEPRSIHQARHRLKNKLGLDRESDLDMFLKKLSFNE